MQFIKDLKAELKKKTDKNPEKYYPIDILISEGYTRNKCKVCQKYFWSISQDEICGEPECMGGYNFIHNPIGKEIGFIDVWKNFSLFFSKRGYNPIKRYPVAARWRDDTDFVQASIYNFQPYVVTGEIEPPSNPLVVPQYCVRFNSIDSIGITGRHNTGFVMIGQHAFFPEERFNKSNYFRDLFEWFVKEIKIPKYELKIIESQWGGGGNLGVCLELFSRGLELANQVYMLYRITSNGYEDLNLKVLDMGMGQDRVSWLTKGTTTIYEIDYPLVCEKLYRKTGCYPNEVYDRFIPYGSILDVDSNLQLNEMWIKIANYLNVKINDLEEKVLPLAALYSIADHTQTLLVSINDGVLPSNVGGGYNLRVILRRSLRFLEKYKWDLELIDVCEWHAKALSTQYPELKENLNELQEILDYEISKYKNTQRKARIEISKIIEQGIQLTEKELYTLYESKGIMPDVVKDMFKNAGKNINIPSDFYSKLTSLHTIERIDIRDGEFRIEDKIKNINGTEILYYKPIQDFYAKIMRSWSDNGHFYCILDKTAFFPQSGGQDHDKGKIDDCEVIDVKKYGDVIVHQISKGVTEGKTVHCIVDYERRDVLAKMHTAAHIINGSARELLGKHIWQAGSNVAINKSRLDITHFKRLTKNEMDKLNEIANRIIKENRPVAQIIMKRNEAEKKYGFRIYQGGSVPGKELRIIEIDNFDTEACGGTHVNNTSKVEEILVYKNKGIHDGVVRLEFVAGRELCKRIKRKLKLEKTKEEERAKRKIERAKKEKEIKRKAKEEAEILDIKFNTVNYIPNKNFIELKSIGRAIVKDNSDKFIILLSEGIIYAKKGERCNINIESIIRKVAETFGGGFGRKGYEWSGGGPFTEKTKNAYEIAKKSLTRNSA